MLQFNDKNFNEIKIYSYTEHPIQEYATVYPFFEKGATGEYTLIKDGSNATLSVDNLLDEGVDVLANYLHIADNFVLKKIK